MSESEITDLVILGRKIGTCTGFDQQDTDVFTFYDFLPSNVTLPATETLTVAYSEGYFMWGEESRDIIEIIQHLPRITP